MLFRVIFHVNVRRRPTPIPGPDLKALGTRTPRVPGGRKGGRLAARSQCLARRRVAELTPQGRIPASNATIGSPRRPADEKGQETGKSPNMCPGLHRTNMVGHDPQHKRETVTTGRLRSLNEVGHNASLELRHRGCHGRSPKNKTQDDALRQRGPPGPLARTHRG